MGQLHGRGAIRVEGGKGVAWGGDLCECTPLFGNDQLSGHDLFDEGGIRDSEGTRQRQWYERLCRIYLSKSKSRDVMIPRSFPPIFPTSTPVSWARKTRELVHSFRWSPVSVTGKEENPNRVAISRRSPAETTHQKLHRGMCASSARVPGWEREGGE